MKHVPSYGKVLALGAAFTERIFEGEVVVQEKIDGSQFKFGVNEDKQVVAASKSVAFNDFRQPDGMFQQACLYIESIEQLLLSSFPADSYFYGEYLQSPHHNTLTYDRVPKNNIVIFDAVIAGKQINDRAELEEIATKLDIDIIPELYRGEVNGEKVKELLNTTSYLGGPKIEGVVVKNYNEIITLGGMVFPLFTKYVSEEFKEKHHLNPEYISKADKLGMWMLGYRTEARWEKAFQYLRDKGEIENQPRDIAKLFKRVQEDIAEEEKENIKEELYNMFIKDLLKRSTGGMPEWYKEKLLSSLATDDK